MPLRGYPLILGQSDYSDSLVQLHDFGMPAFDRFGRRFRYARAGTTALVAGTALQSPVWPTDQTNLAVAANAAIADTTVTVTNGGSNAITANQYVGGMLVTETTPGHGYTYSITSNSAAATGATITLKLGSPLIVAITAASSKVSLVLNEYNGVIIFPTTQTGIPVGVAVYPIRASYFGWIGTGGTHNTLIDATGAIAIAQAVSPSGAVAGSVAINSGTLPIVGIARTAGADTKFNPVYWTIK